MIIFIIAKLIADFIKANRSFDNIIEADILLNTLEGAAKHFVRRDAAEQAKLFAEADSITRAAYKELDQHYLWLE